MDMNRYESEGMLTEPEPKPPRDLTNPQIAQAIMLANITGEPVVCWWDGDEFKVRYCRLSDYESAEGQAFVDERDIIAIVS
jgi:hypothetical protein